MNKDLVLVVDMKGCPNRCKHCWLGHMPNKSMSEDTDIFLINYFQESFENITYYSWLREPDFKVNYKERWIKDTNISINKKPIRFELASFYLLNRDKEYVKFLKEIGVEIVQLTFFGLEDKTDFYIGRKGAFKELLNATDILISNGIAPRFQIFINEDNKDEIETLIELWRTLKIKQRVESIGKEFKLFITVGSCDGENEKLYSIRLNKCHITETIKKYLLNYNSLYSEKELAISLLNDNSYFIPTNNQSIVLNISNELDVFFNFTHMRTEWKIGNILNDDKTELIDKIITENTFALSIARSYTVSSLVKQYADFSSDKLFEREDYLMYLLNKKVYEVYYTNK